MKSDLLDTKSLKKRERKVMGESSAEDLGYFCPKWSGREIENSVYQRNGAGKHTAAAPIHLKDPYVSNPNICQDFIVNLLVKRTSESECFDYTPRTDPVRKLKS
jgi:hypothetical protein